MNLSIIIPTFNEAPYIKACIQSLFKQTYTLFEIIVIDDGSTDNTIEILKHLKKEHSSLKLLTQLHKGAGIARNKGAKQAQGEILVFVDADMTFDKEFLKNLVRPIMEGSAVGTFSKREYVSNWDNVWARCWNWNLNLPNKMRLPDNYPNEQKVFRAISKNEFNRVGGFSVGGYTDDWSLSEKLHVLAQNAPHAIFYHSNPENLSDVFNQAQWSAKREYKLGLLGAAVGLIRTNILLSSVVGITKSIKYREWRFLLFKIIYDIGIGFGIISYVVSKNGAK